MQALFQIDVSKTDAGAAIEHVLDGAPADDYLSRLVNGVIKHQNKIDEVIKKHLEKWTIERLAIVDRNLLRIALFELMFCADEVPPNAAINEAVEIAKTFGDENSGKFVNGILAKVKEKGLSNL